MLKGVRNIAVRKVCRFCHHHIVLRAENVTTFEPKIDTISVRSTKLRWLDIIMLTNTLNKNNVHQI